MPVTLILCFSEADLEKWSRVYVGREGPKRNASEDRIMAFAVVAGGHGALTRDEFIEIARWKSTRPTRFYKSNSAELVAGVTRRSFADAHDTERVLLLTELAGVNVRTATAILHLCFPDNYPLLDVWALTAFGVGREITEKWDELDWLRVWPEYVKACRAIADRTKLDLRTIDRALWAFGESVGSRRKKISTSTEMQSN